MAQTKTQTKTTRTRKKSSGPTKLKSFNPTTGEVMREIPANSPGEVRDIVEQARKVAPEWAAIDPEGRSRILKKVRYRAYELLDDLVDTISKECGKPRAEALGFDVVPMMLQFLYFERLAPKALRPERTGPIIGPIMGATSKVQWRPFGVVGCITPWNYPLYNCMLATAPALFAGNTVVIKPSEVTPGVGELLKQLLDPLPAGVASVVQGGGEVGAALVDAPCDKISFIGSPPTGRKIAEAAGKHLTPCVMELGGQDPAIVCADADLDFASSGIAWGSFFNAGQTCCSIERAYVVDEVADEFTDKLLEKISHLSQGGDDGQMGSLTFKPQLETVRRHVDDAVKKGAEVLAGGPEAGLKNENGSLWYAPTVLGSISEDMDVINEETFGPVLTLVRVSDEDQAVQRANEGVNLTASVWTKDSSKGERIASLVKAGTVGINDHGAAPGAAWSPWGGVGESGYGRLNGKLGIREFTVPVHIQKSTTGSMRRLWWYPYDDAMNDAMSSIATVLGAPTLSKKMEGVRSLVGAAGRAIKAKF